MGLWIMSQDNGLYELKIILPPYEDGSLWGKIEGECILLGKYKSKERASEILHEIENKIVLLGLGMDFGSPMADIKNPYNIYKMPKE